MTATDTQIDAERVEQKRRMELYIAPSSLSPKLTELRFARPDCKPHALHRHRQLSQHELRAQPEHAIPHTLKLTVTHGIRTLPPAMPATVHLHDEPERRCIEVSDEAPEQRHSGEELGGRVRYDIESRRRRASKA
ncbi:MAG TPA: hypothetical protein VGI10_16480 [Polyangiaceae bacterium]|jgi:hypothetical protein